MHDFNQSELNLLKKLKAISKLGPVPAVGKGKTNVNTTLFHYLGHNLDSSKKSEFEGVRINTSRGVGNYSSNRTNLFAKVANWKLSKYKSSAEFLDAFGYAHEDRFRLNCTVSATTRNAQGLALEIDQQNGLLTEIAVRGGSKEHCLVWETKVLIDRLMKTQSGVFRVTAESQTIGGVEHFSYRNLVVSGDPDLDSLFRLIDSGGITLDHLIERKPNGKVTEKGPLFKIAPNILNSLFNIRFQCDLWDL